jgi:hypothetical protein
VIGEQWKSATFQANVLRSNLNPCGNSSEKNMKKIILTVFSIALSAAILGAGNDGDNDGTKFASGGVNIMGGRRGPLVRAINAALPSSGETNTFVETYDDGTDVGLWVAAFSVPRIIEPSGGNPGAYLQQGGFSTSIPTWASVSTRYQPGVNDDFKVDSIYTGDWTSLGVTSISADLNVIQVATWATDRAVTLELLQMDETGFNVNYDATYTLPDLPQPPVGWQTYSFPVDANSPTIPQGWVFTRGDGTPGTDAEWSPFLHRVDLTSIGFYKPGFAYPSLGTWILGIDNIEIDFQAGPIPTPTPSATISPTPTGTPTSTPTPSATPRPRPTPHIRPTPP